MTNVLMAIDKSQESRHAAEVAAACFGPSATYLAIYVDENFPVGGPMWGTGLGWGGVYACPNLYADLDRQARAGEAGADSLGVGNADAAQAEAERLVAEVGVVAEPLGDVGSPALAITNATREHDVDVIVVGAHNRGCFSKLLLRSTTDAVLHEAAVPVLVVPAAGA